MTPAGRRTAIPQDLLDKMVAWREAGRTLPSIAEQLNDDGVPTPGGGAAWYPQSVRQAILAEQKRRRVRELSTAMRKSRELRLVIRDVDEAAFAAIANALWFAASASGSDDFEVGYDGVTAKALNKSWREGPAW